MEILFVGGITGSGKTTVCARMVELLYGRGQVIHVGSIATVAASENALATESIEKATLQALDRCQHLVLSRIAKQISRLPNNVIFILDGHFVLGGIGRPPYRQPKWFFSAIGITRLVLCAPEVSEIRRRIIADAQRVRPAVVVDALEYYMELEKLHALSIAEHCRLPLTVIRNVEEVTQICSQLMG